MAGAFTGALTPNRLRTLPSTHAPSSQESYSSQAFARRAEHPALAGLEGDDLAHWLPDGLVGELLCRAALVLPACNTYAMNLHLAEIARNVAKSAHAVLVVDQAGWHMTDKLAVPSNITILPLPPKCPELNPVENVWQFMRDNWLSDRVFTSYDDIVDHCCGAWNKLVEQPWRIMSIGLRDWAHGF